MCSSDVFRNYLRIKKKTLNGILSALKIFQQRTLGGSLERTPTGFLEGASILWESKGFFKNFQIITSGEFAEGAFGAFPYANSGELPEATLGGFIE